MRRHDGISERLTRAARVLLVDDDSAVRRVIARLLSADYAVSVAADGIEALERMAADGPFDAILCDIDMPRMGGLTLYAKLRSIAPEHARRLAFITGLPLVTDAVPRPCLHKPISAGQLRAMIEAVLSD